jgi:broad specificity phosphatase PhoE
MRLILVRHGESAGNVARVIQGDAEYPLTEVGLAQARAVAATLARADLGPVAALYTSPLGRALRTAEEIGLALGVPPTVDPDLRECGAGVATGLTWLQFAARYRSWAARVATDESGRIVEQLWPGGETTSALRARIGRAVDGIVARHADDSGAVVVVAHSGSIVWALAHLLAPGGDRWPDYQLPNASVSEVEIVAGRARAVRIGVEIEP